MLTNSYRTETAKKVIEISTLADSTTPRIFQVTRCSQCGSQLDLPSIHFMCRHSFHQRFVRILCPSFIPCRITATNDTAIHAAVYRKEVLNALTVSIIKQPLKKF